MMRRWIALVLLVGCARNDPRPEAEPSADDGAVLGGASAGGASIGGAAHGGASVGGAANGGAASSGDPCGDCGAGTWSSEGHECVYGSFEVDPIVGMPPSNTGQRQVFDPEDYPGSDTTKLQAASQAAAAVGGAVVMTRVYETNYTVFAYSGVLYTGGGIRRACSPVATTTSVGLAQDNCLHVDQTAGFEPGTIVAAVTGPGFDGHVALVAVVNMTGTSLCSNVAIGAEVPAGATVIQVHSLLRGTPTYTNDVVIDSVLLDGANRCNPHTHNWTYNDAVALRGSNTIRHSVIYDSPSESLTTCGGLVENNVAFNLQGSFIHKSCVMSPEPFDVISGNYVDGANASGDEVMKHSEGLITHSANAGNILSMDNVFLNGSEGVFGLAGPDDEDVHAERDCYGHFSHVIRLYGGADQSSFQFDAELIDVPTVFAEP